MIKSRLEVTHQKNRRCMKLRMRDKIVLALRCMNKLHDVVPALQCIVRRSKDLNMIQRSNYIQFAMQTTHSKDVSLSTTHYYTSLHFVQHRLQLLFVLKSKECAHDYLFHLFSMEYIFFLVKSFLSFDKEVFCLHYESKHPYFLHEK